MDELESKRLVFLAIKLFKQNNEGQEFLELMKKRHFSFKTFPPNKLEKIEWHGGPLGWAAFREGQLDTLREIETMIQCTDYLNETEVKK